DDTFYFRNIVFDFDTIPIDSLTEELNELKSVVLLEKNQIIKLINRISAGRMVKSIELEIKSEIPNASIKFKCHDSIMKSSEIVKAKAKNVIDVAISLDFDSLLQAIKQIPTKEFIVKYSNNNNKLAIISSDKEIISLIPTN
ncbi:MAG: hypothetical protein N2486_10775, partial [Caloramator sp.]|nr:hypothetical protein [Caloramator sp.]